MLPVGSRLGPYEITAPLSLEGTERYRAYDHRAHREVTLQVVRVELDVGPERQQRDALEIYQAVTGTDTVYVVSVAAARDTPGVPIDAQTMSVEDATRWAVQVAQASGVGPQKIVRPRWRWTPLRRGAAGTGAMVAAAVAIWVVVIRTMTAPNGSGAPPVVADDDATARAATGLPLVPLTPPAPLDAPVAPIPTPAVVPVAAAAPRRAPTAPPPRAPVRTGAIALEPSPATPARPLSPVVADGRDAASLMTEASVRATEFDLAGAVELLKAAASRGDVSAQVGVHYIRGLLEAREAFRDGGPGEKLAPIRQAIASLEAIAKGRPGSAEIARLTLHAAAAASQSERDEMSLYLETALEMESLQRMAGSPGAPLVTVAEVAGDLWLQVHRYEDARRAYTEAADRGGFTLRILSGLARTARRLNDLPAACGSYRRLLEAWGGRPGLPVEIAEARAYLGGCAP